MAPNDPSADSPVTFTVASGQHDIFSLTDAFVPGDVYSVTVGGVTTISTFTSYPGTFPLGLGASPSTYDAAWADNTFSHLQLGFGAGDYSLSILGDGAGGFPAGFAFRLDSGTLSVSACPRAVNLGDDGAGLCRRRLHGLSAEAGGYRSAWRDRAHGCNKGAAFERPFWFLSDR